MGSYMVLARDISGRKLGLCHFALVQQIRDPHVTQPLPRCISQSGPFAARLMQYLVNARARGSAGIVGRSRSGWQAKTGQLLLVHPHGWAQDAPQLSAADGSGRVGKGQEEGSDVCPTAPCSFTDPISHPVGPAYLSITPSRLPPSCCSLRPPADRCAFRALISSFSWSIR